MGVFNWGNRRASSVLTACAVVGAMAAAACDQGTETTAPASEFAVQSALMGGGIAFNDGGPQPAIMGRLVHTALSKIAHRVSADSARAAGANLKTLVDAARAAHQAGETVAAHTAMDAVRRAEAAIVIAGLGSDAVTHALSFADTRVQELNERISKATEDRSSLEALAANLTQILADAHAADAAGDEVSALIGAAKVIEALHIVNAHHHIGGPGALPLDTTRVRPPVGPPMGPR